MIYITGDTHREQDIYKINPDDGFERGKHLTQDDYVIICGDFGCVWDGGKGDDFWLDWLDSLPWTTCFIDGNHENFNILNQYPVQDWHGGKIHRIRDKIVHLMRGEIFDIDGMHFFTFGGAISHDAEYRTENVNWWKAELPVQSEIENAWQNLQRYNNKVDVVLSHDVFEAHPYSKLFPIHLEKYGPEYVNIQSFLQEIETKVEYDYWFHGHYHKDIWFRTPSNKPCLCLFESVIEFDSFIDNLPNIPMAQNLE